MRSFILGIIICIIIFVGIPFWFYYQKNVVNYKTVTDKVLNEQRVCSSSGNSCKYLIYTNKEVFEDTDTLWFRKFNSSDIFGELQPGVHTFTVVGWRVPFLSWYRNIIKVKN